MILLAALVVLASAPGSGGDRAPRDISAAESERRAAELRSRIVRIEERLRSTDAKTSKWARRAADSVYEDMLSTVAAGASAARFFATVQLFRAVAEARLGDLDAAAWHWQEAHGLAPELRDIAPRSFPDLAAFFRAHLLGHARLGLTFQPDPPAPTLQTPASTEPAGDADSDPGAGVTPPELLRSIRPVFPRAGWATGRSGKTAVQVVIDTAGVPHAPVVTESSGVIGFDVAAMEAFREWRFKPAQRAGKPVSAYYTLTVTYLPN